MAASIRSRRRPLGPTNGLPCRSSSAPGASPTSITGALGLPSAKQSRVAVSASGQPPKVRSAASSSSSVRQRLASARAEGTPPGSALALRPGGGGSGGRAAGCGSVGRCGSGVAARRSKPRSSTQSSTPTLTYQSAQAAMAWAGACGMGGSVIGSARPRLGPASRPRACCGLDGAVSEGLAAAVEEQLAALVLCRYVAPVANRRADIEHGFDLLPLVGLCLLRRAAGGRIVLALRGLEHFARSEKWLKPAPPVLRAGRAKVGVLWRGRGPASSVRCRPTAALSRMIAMHTTPSAPARGRARILAAALLGPSLPPPLGAWAGGGGAPSRLLLPAA